MTAKAKRKLKGMLILCTDKKEWGWLIALKEYSIIKHIAEQ